LKISRGYFTVGYLQAKHAGLHPALAPDHRVTAVRQTIQMNLTTRRIILAAMAGFATRFTSELLCMPLPLELMANKAVMLQLITLILWEAIRQPLTALKATRGAMVNVTMEMKAVRLCLQFC
jgi:hypothetical protein